MKGNFWKWNKERTGGVTEITYKNNVPGKGKTTLDGLFGILTQHLNGLVDEGHSFECAEELYDLLKKNPLQYTEIHLLNLDRKIINDWTVPKFIEKYRLGRSYYLIKHVSDTEAKAFFHSRHGDGVLILFVNDTDDQWNRMSVKELKDWLRKKK